MQEESKEISVGDPLGAGASSEMWDLIPRVLHRILTPIAVPRALAGGVALFE